MNDPAVPGSTSGTYHTAVTKLIDTGATPELLKRFVEAHTFPLTSSGQVTFVWIGEADEVVLLQWIHGHVDRTEFESIPGTPLWLLRLPVPDGGRFEYKLGIKQGDHEHWIVDPLNDAKAQDPYGENSVCRTFGYAQPDWSKPQGAPAGTFSALAVASSVFGETRNEQVYLPAHYQPDATYPLLIIHDGVDFVTYGDLAISLDNLIAQGDISPIVVALVQTPDRMGEYPRGHRHARYLVSELLPQLRAEFCLSEDTQDNVLLGASLGAVASLATVYRYPHVFGGVVLHSGSFILDDRKLKGRPHPVFSRVARLVKAFKRSPKNLDLRAFVSTGELEGLASENQALAQLLQENGVNVLFKSAWDGHHWHNWRDQLRDGLIWVLNGRK